MYGYGNVTKYFSSLLVRPSAGASNSNAFSFSHFACTSRSIFCKNSTLNVPFRSSPAYHRTQLIQQRQQKIISSEFFHKIVNEYLPFSLWSTWIDCGCSFLSIKRFEAINSNDKLNKEIKQLK